MNVLFVTSEWPCEDHPNQVPFIVQQAKYLEARGINVSVFHYRGARSIVGYLQARRRLREQYNLNDFDLIHMHFGQSGLVVYPTETPTITTFWGSDLFGIVNRHGRYTIVGKLLRTISRWTARWSSESIVVSKRMLALLPSSKHAHVVYHGVDLSLFRPLPKSECREELSLSREKKYVLFVSNELRGVKRFPLAKKAMELLDTDNDIELLAVTHASHNEMPIYMNACDCLVLTSKHEGSPTVIKEAIACGLPIVSVDVGDVRERIELIGGCFLCETDSVECIASNLKKALEVGKLNTTKEVLNSLDEKQQIQRLIDVYQLTLSRKERLH